VQGDVEHRGAERHEVPDRRRQVVEPGGIDEQQQGPGEPQREQRQARQPRPDVGAVRGTAAQPRDREEREQDRDDGGVDGDPPGG
jgi:hypothetical protein